MSFNNRCAVLALMMSAAFPLLADGLQKGDWNGSYTPYHSSTLDAWYEIRYLDQEGEKQLSIKMTIDLEPRANFTYLLEDIVIDADKIVFKIKKPQETKSCKLMAQDNGDYLGQCQSDIDTEGKHLTEILMIPPPVTVKPDDAKEEMK